MEKLVIEGGVPLHGDIRVGGSKNAALPILFASLLLDGSVTLQNVPYLSDIDTTIAILRVLGCQSGFTDNDGHSVKIDAGSLVPDAPYDLVKTMRASVLALGPLLARLGRASIPLPGGCAIGMRPVEQHTKALEKMGAKLVLDSGHIVGRCKKLRGANITFDFPTVGGTEHLIITAALADGDTLLRNCAREPEVVDLANFLNSCGAKISGHGTDTISIKGVTSLRGDVYSIIPDRIEAGTFLAAVTVTGGSCDIVGCPVEALATVIAKMDEMGVIFESHAGGVTVRHSGHLRGVEMTTRPYPGFPTDMQAQLMSMMTLAEGNSIIEETIFENRFMHVPEMMRMGADIRLSGSRAFIRGVKQLTGVPVVASDLRASASLVVAGLAAKGKTSVQSIYHLDRGYERIEHKLERAGARIRRV